MKKTITFSIAALTALSVSAQLPVSQVPGKKQALIEEFTGNTCGYCPDGHKISDQITAANPGKAFAINIHTGSYATPSSSAASKDFRVTDGNSIIAISGMGVTGFPAGAINRKTPSVTGPSVPMTAGGLAMSRGGWAANVSAILSENTYVNIAGQAYLHPTTRQLIVNMEAYYTGNAPSGVSNRISVALIQDDIVAYQGGASSYYPAMLQTPGNNDTYKHQHALRDILTTGATGETMTVNEVTGTKWTKTYTYTVAATYPASGTKAIPAVLADLEIVAFISETEKNVVAVCKVPITITTATDIFGPAAASDLVSNVSVYPNPMANEGVAVFTLAKESSVKVNVVNALGQVVKSDNLETLTAGEHKYELDATNLTNGIYFVSIQVGENVTTKKISILK